jgi:hypothetical protein
MGIMHELTRQGLKTEDTIHIRGAGSFTY